MSAPDADPLRYCDEQLWLEDKAERCAAWVEAIPEAERAKWKRIGFLRPRPAAGMATWHPCVNLVFLAPPPSMAYMLFPIHDEVFEDADVAQLAPILAQQAAHELARLLP